jgi:hypothetical protein
VVLIVVHVQLLQQVLLEKVARLQLVCHRNVAEVHPIVRDVQLQPYVAVAAPIVEISRPVVHP